MEVKRYIGFFGILLTTFLLGCSDSGDSDPAPQTNPQTVTVGQTTNLSAPKSDPGNDQLATVNLSYYWEFVSVPTGSMARLTDPSSPYPTFVADIAGVYVLKLSIYNENTLVAENTIQIVAEPQNPDIQKPKDHIATNDMCSTCHLPDVWIPAKVDHNQVLGPCNSCHEKPFGHVRSTDVCETCHDTASWSADVALLHLNRALWDSADIASYQFTYQCNCLLDGDLVITVTNGTVTEAYYAASGNPIPGADLAAIMTITKLFDLIEHELQAGSTLSVIYNIQYGYPEGISINGTDTVNHLVKDFLVLDVPQPDPAQALLDENRRLWLTAGIVDYQFNYFAGCFLCDQQEDIVIVVTGGHVSEAHYTPSGTPLSANQIATLPTIDILFGRIQSAINTHAAELKVTYNALYGYPESIFIDPSADMFDDQISYSVTNFQKGAPPSIGAEQRRLNASMVIWQKSMIGRYKFVYNKLCFCLPEENIAITVDNGVVTEAFYTPSGTPLTSAQLATVPTVETLFAVIQNAIDTNVAALTVNYNAVHGYPEKIAIDPDANVVDDEITHSVLDFTPIPVAPPPPSPAQAALNENMALWQQAAIADFQYTYNRLCFCVPQEDIVVTVTAGVISGATFTPSGTVLTPAQLANVMSIDKLFAVIQGAIDSNAAVLNVTYNARYGYPESIYIDHALNIADDEITHNVLNFQLPVTPPPPPVDWQKLLDKNIALWQNSGIAFYVYTFSKSCFCPPEEDIIISVSGGQVVGAVYTPSGTALDPALYPQLKTVEGMFAIVQDAINNANQLSVTFNSQYGYPESISIDWSAFLVDDEITYSMRDFVAAANPLPAWMNRLITSVLLQPVTNPPTQIIQYDYNGAPVYYVPPRCCDIWSDLYDASGNIICHPDGGIAGGGDGLCPDFLKTRTNPILVWQDSRV